MPRSIPACALRPGGRYGQPECDRFPGCSIPAAAGPSRHRTAADNSGAVGEFTEGRRVRLDPANSRSAGFAQVLEGARRLGTAVYLETDPATSVITRLLIPLVARVVALRPGATGSVEVEVMPSHARHILRRDQPDFGQFQELLNDASRSGQPLIVTDDEGHTTSTSALFGRALTTDRCRLYRLGRRFRCSQTGFWSGCAGCGAGPGGPGGGSAAYRRRMRSRSLTR